MPGNSRAGRAAREKAAVIDRVQNAPRGGTGARKGGQRETAKAEEKGVALPETTQPRGGVQDNPSELDWEPILPILQQLHARRTEDTWSYRFLIFPTLAASLAVPLAVVGTETPLVFKASREWPWPIGLFGLWVIACLIMAYAVYLMEPFSIAGRSDSAEPHLKGARNSIATGQLHKAAEHLGVAIESQEQHLKRSRESRLPAATSLAIFLLCAGIAFSLIIFGQR